MTPAPSEPQTPADGEIFLDHVGWFVPDMDAASAAFMRLGFALTPYTVHTNERPDGTRAPSGTANRCAMIARGYLEILARVPGVESPLTRQLQAGLSRYTGLHLIAFTVAEADEAARRLREAGFSPQAPVALRRSMPLDAGGEGTAAFTVLRIPDDEMPEGRVQILTQDAPEVVWQPSVTARDNALDMLSGLLVCAADPSEAAGRYARFTGRPAAPAAEGAWRIALDRGEIVVAAPAACEKILPGIDVPGLPFMAAVAIRSADLPATRRWLAGRDVPLLADDRERIVIDPRAAMGAAMVLHGRDTPPFAGA